VQRGSRHDLVRALAPRYAHAGRREKGQVLDEVCELTGYTRKYALTLLRDPPSDVPPGKRRRHRLPVYGPAEVELLELCWLVTDGICSKRLAPFLPELLRRLRHWQALHDVPRDVQQRVATMSAATIDRALKGSRQRGKKGRGLSATHPGTLLKRQIAIRTFADWSDARPGFLEMDLVAHCGWSGAGQFLYTLSMVDVATGWVACAGLRDKRAETVFAALRRLQADLPFRVLGLDTDNGSEFLNRALVDYCVSQGITFTRSRPYSKNDTCHIEQKNWAVVRRLVGYDRLEWRALPALDRVHDLARDYVNFLHPVRKLMSKTRSGARVTRRYDDARTPFDRLLTSGSLSTDMEIELKERYAATNPVRLKLQMEAAQRTLAARAVRSDSSMRQA
jgi:Integrase core domain